MGNLKVDWMVFCGRAECEAWLSYMEEECVETVMINTPTDFEAYLAIPFTKRKLMEYFAKDFSDALDILDKQDDPQ